MINLTSYNNTSPSGFKIESATVRRMTVFFSIKWWMRCAYPPYKSFKKYASQVGWISEAHPPLKTKAVIVHEAKNPCVILHGAKTLLDNRYWILLRLR